VRVAYETGASEVLLSGLRAAHCELLKCIGEMEQITQEVAPDAMRYTAARFRIGRASLQRRSVWQAARQHLQGKMRRADSDDIRFLASIDWDLGKCTADHIGRWTVGAIERDWAGYCYASREVRRQMSQCIEAEKRVLYSLLARYA
jgi:hypothetical protein